MAVESRSPIKVLERGDLFYLYRPSVEDFAPGGLIDVRRFYMVLHPVGTERLRLFRRIPRIPFASRAYRRVVRSSTRCLTDSCGQGASSQSAQEEAPCVAFRSEA
jgi:hypothetical protein